DEEQPGRQLVAAYRLLGARHDDRAQSFGAQASLIGDRRKRSNDAPHGRGWPFVVQHTEVELGEKSAPLWDELRRLLRRLLRLRGADVSSAKEQDAQSCRPQGPSPSEPGPP